MPVSYSYEASNNKLFGQLRLLFKWNGSIWKVLFLDAILYFVLYSVIRVIKELALTKNQEEWFDEFCLILKRNIQDIPLAFLLGFFVTQVYSRWTSIYDSIPWPYALVDWLCLALKLPRSVPEDAPDGEAKNQDVKLIVQTVSRYMHLSLAMVMRDICYQFRHLMQKRRLTFVDMGLASESEMRQLYSTSELMPHELQKLNWPNKKNEEKRTASWNWWVPSVWASRLVRDAYDKGYVDSRENLEAIYKKIHDYKGLLGGLIGFDSIPVPLPYTQVVSIGVYTYFFLALFAFQDVESANPDSSYDHYFVPASLLLQFLIYYGWFKVAEVLLTPYGKDLGYNYDMVGYFALHLEQSRAHVEYSYEMDQFLNDDPKGGVAKLANIPREDLFVENIQPHLFGSLVQGFIDIPNFIFDASVALWNLPKSVWNNDLETDRQNSEGGGGAGKTSDAVVYFKNKNANPDVKNLGPGVSTSNLEVVKRRLVPQCGEK
ncbi:bestrophin-3-like isoform X2 [Convolutriloba macropyga]|uniref:bestrophin-3-like isoform X2 n=1 Tax=Convolutriloba macropyga TaxID=536237 RepID=UPI003F5213B8